MRLYSYVPARRAVSFGLPPDSHVGLFSRVWPCVVLQHYGAGWFRRFGEEQSWRVLDRAVARALEPCDVFICMSGIYVEAAVEARRRFGAKIVLVRASKHILEQDEILARTPGAQRPSQLAIERELAGYSLADMIDVPSGHVSRSFERDPVARAKVVVNPYGVNLEEFPLLPERPLEGPITLVVAGAWSLRKGCDLIEAAVSADSRFKLIHVGPIADVDFPHGHPRFRHVPKVDQSELWRIYREADALVQPSREDGFGLVILQALVSGLPVLCTDATGGDDVRCTPALSDRVLTVQSESLSALQRGLDTLAVRLSGREPFAPMTEADREALSWRGYAVRYLDNLSALFA